MKKRLLYMCHLTRQKSRFLFCTLHNDHVLCGSRINLTWIYSPFCRFVVSLICICYTLFCDFIACHDLFSKVLDQKPEFVLKDHFYAVSFIMAWIFTQIELSSFNHAFGLPLYPYRLMHLVNVQQLAMLPVSYGCWCGRGYLLFLYLIRY